MAKQRAWELAEIARSEHEAVHTPDERLRAVERYSARYLDPPLDTVYPLEYAYALLGDVGGRAVLDFGCGSGENSILLARRGARVVGVDISEPLIRLARRRLDINGFSGAARFTVGSAHHLPLGGESVDLVFGIAVLHHLELEGAAREVHRVLKPGGRGIFQEPVRDSRLIRALRRCIPYRAPDVSPFERPLRAHELQQFASRFSAQSTRAFSLPFVNLTRALPPLQRWIHGAHRIDGAILRRLPGLVPFTGIRVLEVIK
jgi:SAM-dependent methyltransferase